MRININCLGEMMLVIGMMVNALERERLVLKHRAFLPEHTLDNHADRFIHPIRFCPSELFLLFLFFPFSVLVSLCWCCWHLPWNSSFLHLWEEARETSRSHRGWETLRRSDVAWAFLPEAWIIAWIIDVVFVHQCLWCFWVWQTCPWKSCVICSWADRDPSSHK